MKILPTFLLTLTFGFTLAQAADAPKGPSSGTGPGREKMREMVLQKFDTNKNGTLDPDEKQAAMKAMQERRAGSPGAKGGPGKGPMQEMILQKFDANKNGVLDPEEKAAAMKSMQERRARSGGTGAAGAGTAPGTTNSEGGSKFRRPPEQSK